MLIVSMLLAAAPATPVAGRLKGLDKPKKEQRATLGESETTRGKVKIRCVDVGASMLVEIDDPGLMGAKEVWLKKKLGDAMPPCDANESGVTHITGIPGYGYVAGTKGDYLFATSADSFTDRSGLRVFSLVTGEQLYETEFNVDQPITLTAEGKSLWLRFHVAVTSTCNPLGAEAASCWKEIRESARVPESVEIKPPPCDAAFKGKSAMPGPALISLPAEVDLSSPKTLKYLPGAATCVESV
jgi:hypothetical protein